MGLQRGLEVAPRTGTGARTYPQLRLRGEHPALTWRACFFGVSSRSQWGLQGGRPQLDTIEATLQLGALTLSFNGFPLK